jgi:SAM-dependent methyltransferase
VANKLEEFYQSWSDNPDHMIRYYNEAAVRKVDAIFDGMPELKELQIKSIIDFGCGYGKALQSCADRLDVDIAYGFDFSESSIEYASANFSRDRLLFSRLRSLSIDENVEIIRSVVSGDKVDCILLIDLLEHIPDCEQMIQKLSELTKYFIIKLPIEENVVDNYFLTKTYPSTKQPNGHLREFNVNSVHYFIRKIGLTPISEGIHIYDFRDSFPPQTMRTTVLRRVKNNILKWGRKILALILPLRIYVRLIGPGSYYCLATYSKEHVLNP